MRVSHTWCTYFKKAQLDRIWYLRKHERNGIKSASIRRHVK